MRKSLLLIGLIQWIAAFGHRGTDLLTTGQDAAIGGGSAAGVGVGIVALIKKYRKAKATAKAAAALKEEEEVNNEARKYLSNGWGAEAEKSGATKEQVEEAYTKALMKSQGNVNIVPKADFTSALLDIQKSDVTEKLVNELSNDFGFKANQVDQLVDGYVSGKSTAEIKALSEGPVSEFKDDFVKYLKSAANPGAGGEGGGATGEEAPPEGDVDVDSNGSRVRKRATDAFAAPYSPSTPLLTTVARVP